MDLARVIAVPNVRPVDFENLSDYERALTAAIDRGEFLVLGARLGSDLHGLDMVEG